MNGIAASYSDQEGVVAVIRAKTSYARPAGID
jgi:hypothetical protein